MDKPWRPPLSQHFLKDRRLVQRLVRASSLSPHDLVLEIGPGRGIITRELLNTAGSVIAVELDGKLCRSLHERFGPHPRLKLVHADFLPFPLPRQPYKVFASIPYRRTGEIIRKLLQSDNPPSDCWLIVQSEAAGKFTPHPGGNSLAALLYYPWWDIRAVHRLRRTDFDPPPKVDSVLLRLTRRTRPLLDPAQKSTYQDYSAYTFGRDGAAKGLSADEFLERFRDFLGRAGPRKRRAIRGAFDKLCAEQRKLRKTHRTRTDPNWKSSCAPFPRRGKGWG
jgi:23S rRNA (adenine-N6)-dimethyltransferase